MSMSDDHRHDSTTEPLERAKDAALGAHHNPTSTTDEVGEAAGGIAGTLFGAAIGSVAGPVGTLIGGIAGALGGWWGGRAVAEAAERITLDDDDYYRAHYESSPHKLGDRGYADIRGAYYLGHVASRNPEYAGRPFADIEPELARGWVRYADAFGDWSVVRPFVREAYERGATGSPATVHMKAASHEATGGIEESSD